MGISTHVLNTAEGRPGEGIKVALEGRRGTDWAALGTGWTDADGRCRELLPENGAVEAGVYRLRFETGEYFAAMGTVALYPWVEIVFEVRDPGRHYHVPLLLTAHGYTTYRGS